MSALLLSRTLLYRDTHGEMCEVRIESNDLAELDRVERLYNHMENSSNNGERRWGSNHATFTDSDVEPDRVAEAVDGKSHTRGFPWDSDDEHYAFALLLGEGDAHYVPSSWHQHTEEGRDGKPDVATYGNEAVKGGPCPLHSERPLPLVTACLRCCRTGRDVAIPRPTTRDLKIRHERMPTWQPPQATKVPPPLRNKLGKVLAGGLTGKR